MGPTALLAKLAGTLVAHADGSASGADFRIRTFYVTRELRGKRIGRGLLLRLEELAAGLQCLRLVGSLESPCARFFESAGFVRNDGVLTRKIEHFSTSRNETIIHLSLDE